MFKFATLAALAFASFSMPIDFETERSSRNTRPTSNQFPQNKFTHQMVEEQNVEASASELPGSSLRNNIDEDDEELDFANYIKSLQPQEQQEPDLFAKTFAEEQPSAAIVDPADLLKTFNETDPVLAAPRFTRFFSIILENTDWSEALAEVFFRDLAPQGRLFTNMHGTTHPSQPNYIAMVAGSDFGYLTDNDFNITANEESVVDILEEKGFTWKSYQVCFELYNSLQQNYPGGCNPLHGTKDGLYQRKHNPFMSFDNIRTNKTRCANIVNDSQLEKDIQSKTVPDYVLYTPNQIHDGHGIPDSNGVYPNATLEITTERVAAASKWLSEFLPPLLANPYFNETLFLVTFDENDVVYLHKHDDAAGINNVIYTVALGAGVEVNSTDENYYNHYSQLALLQKEWNLETLGRNDSTANPFLLSDINSTSVTNSTFPTVPSSGSAITASFASLLVILGLAI